MSTATLIRVAAVISLIFAAGHTLGGRKDWSPMGETDVLRAMRTVRFDTMGVSRTYLDFFRGFGYCLSVSMLLQSVLLFQLAGLAQTSPTQVRPMVASLMVASVANGVLSWLFIFPIPAIFSAVLSVVLGAAVFMG